jgi:hypothetical protein
LSPNKMSPNLTATATPPASTPMKPTTLSTTPAAPRHGNTPSE